MNNPWYKRNKASKETRENAKVLRKFATPEERKLWHYLRKKQLGYKFRRQSVIRGYIADFYCPKLRLIIEVDGLMHSRAKDCIRDFNISKSTAIFVMRFTNREVNDRIDKVVAEIKGFIADLEQW